MGNLKLRSMRGFPSSEPPRDQPCPSSPSCFWGAPVEPLDGGLDSLHPCSWQFPAAAPAMAHVHGTRSDLSWDWDRPTPGAGSSSALTQGRESLGRSRAGGPTWSRAGDPGVGGTEFQHELPECLPGTGIPTLLEAPQPTLSGGRSNSGPCIWLYKTGLEWLQPLLCIKSQSTIGNCLWTAHPTPLVILGRGSIPTSPSQRG